MSGHHLKLGTEAEFFQRGREIACLADQQRRIPAAILITLEDAVDVLKLLASTPLAPQSADNNPD
ncbi:MAG: hypothetical protein ACREWI_08470 [Telluria sp.]